MVKSHWPSGPRPTDGAAASISGRGQEGVLQADAPGRGHAGRTEFRREQVSSLCSSGPQERARADTGWTGPRLRTDLGAIAEQFEAPRSRRQWVWTEGSRGQGPGLRQARVRHGGDPPRGGSWWGGAGEGDAPLCPRTLSRVAGRGQVGRGSRKGPAGPGEGRAGGTEACGQSPPRLRSARGKQRTRVGTRGERGLGGFPDRAWARVSADGASMVEGAPMSRGGRRARRAARQASGRARRGAHGRPLACGRVWLRDGSAAAAYRLGGGGAREAVTNVRGEASRHERRAQCRLARQRRRGCQA